jgi:hypothetical protein
LFFLKHGWQCCQLHLEVLPVEVEHITTQQIRQENLGCQASLGCTETLSQT